jgi:hypothetical protein
MSVSSIPPSAASPTPTRASSAPPAQDNDGDHDGGVKSTSQKASETATPPAAQSGDASRGNKVDITA